jgi:hypothetical protein
MKKLFLNSYFHLYALVTFILFAIPNETKAALKFEFKSLITPNSIEELLLVILNTFIVIAVPIIVLYIIYAGFLYVTARGNAEQTKQATQALTYAVIGGVIVIGAVAIAEVIKNVVAAFTAP